MTIRSATLNVTIVVPSPWTRSDITEHDIMEWGRRHPEVELIAIARSGWSDGTATCSIQGRTRTEPHVRINVSGTTFREALERLEQER